MDNDDDVGGDTGDDILDNVMINDNSNITHLMNQNNNINVDEEDDDLDNYDSHSIIRNNSEINHNSTILNRKKSKSQNKQYYSTNV